ncbi:MAG: SCO family protein [bacterium]|nr:SCO family protein [bacterium]
MAETPPPTAPEAPAEERVPFFRNPFVWFFFVGIITITLIRPFLIFEPDPPPVLYELPAFELVDAGGRPFDNGSLEGGVHVVNFIFTRCASICPMLTHSMSSLQERYDAEKVDGIRLISISVDPEYDTPERLAAYAERHGADTSRWDFLTGGEAAVRALVVGGFKTAMEDVTPPDADLIDIAHSGHFFLVDGDGGVRGYYGVDESGLDEIFHRSRHVLKQQRKRRSGS